MITLLSLSKVNEIDFTTRIVVKDKITNAFKYCTTFMDFRETSFYKQNAHKKVKVCRTTLDNTLVVYL